jgi:hypothetical protein
MTALLRKYYAIAEARVFSGFYEEGRAFGGNLARAAGSYTLTTGQGDSRRMA